MYVRIAQDRYAQNGWYRVDASKTPKHEPLKNPSDGALPTVTFVLEVEIPDDAFKPAKWPEMKLTVDPASARGIIDTSVKLAEFRDAARVLVDSLDSSVIEEEDVAMALARIFPDEQTGPE